MAKRKKVEEAGALHSEASGGLASGASWGWRNAGGFDIESGYFSGAEKWAGLRACEER